MHETTTTRFITPPSSSSESASALAPTVCEPCKRRKKSCNKALPSCGRCSRLLVKCSYESGSMSGNMYKQLPPLGDVVPGIFTTSIPTSTNNTNKPWPIPSPPESLSRVKGENQDQIDSQISRLLSVIGRKKSGVIDAYTELYFRTLNPCLPAICPDTFYAELEDWERNGKGKGNGKGVLLLAMFLVSRLMVGDGDGDGEKEREMGAEKELYKTLKSIWWLKVGAGGEGGKEMIQTGVLIASWEWCQGFMKEAWVTVGVCVRLAQAMGLHLLTRRRGETEEERCVWWCVVVLERIIALEYGDGKLPFSSKGPMADDHLPLVPLEDGIIYRVKDDILLPSDIDLSNPRKIGNRGFSVFGPFAATVQVTHLTDLVTNHILDGKENLEDEARLDIALQHFSGACIPPPGKAEGKYCGAYGIRTSAAFSLHLHALEFATQKNDTVAMNRASSSLQSIAKMMIYATKASFQGVPLDRDEVAFWSHRIVAISALIHIRFGERNQEWEEDLEVLKRHLRYYAPRFGVYANYLHEIEEAETSIMIS